jgi:hypothetical protein
MKQQQSQKKDPPRPNAELGENQGEGNVEAGRHYNEKTRDFVESGEVDDAARRATPQSSQESEDLRRAEEQGRSHAKEEDPALRRGGSDKPDRQR